MNENNSEQRQALINDIMNKHAMGDATLGTAIRRLRLEVTGLDQETFAAMCGMSTKALYQIEKDKGNPGLGTLEAILRKFGLSLGLVRSPKNAPAAVLGQQKGLAKSPARGASPRRKTPDRL